MAQIHENIQFIAEIASLEHKKSNSKDVVVLFGDLRRLTVEGNTILPTKQRFEFKLNIQKQFTNFRTGDYFKVTIPKNFDFESRILQNENIQFLHMVSGNSKISENQTRNGQKNRIFEIESLFFHFGDRPDQRFEGTVVKKTPEFFSIQPKFLDEVEVKNDDLQFIQVPFNEVFNPDAIETGDEIDFEFYHYKITRIYPTKVIKAQSL